MRIVPHRRNISKDVKEIVVRMADQGVKPKQIRQYTTVAESTQRRIRRLHRLTGEVAKKAIVCGRRRALTGLNVSVSGRLLSLAIIWLTSQYLIGCIERRPDITLEELRTGLQASCGIDVSIATVSRTLRRWGFVRNKVHTVLFSQLVR